MRIAQWLAEAKLRLARAEVASPSLEGQMLAAHALLVDRSFVLTHPDHEFPALAGEHLLRKRERHEPLAYILGWREFYGRRFKVAPGVLIPRQETETLVEAALDFLRSLGSSAGGGPSVFDLGTGSGCIAITIKLEEPPASVDAADISEKALEIARSNACELGADVRFEESDGLPRLNREFDLIVSNPPYVAANERLPAEIADFEPREALVAGETGLEFLNGSLSEPPIFFARTAIS